MKIGYDHALKILLEEYKKLITKTDSDSKEKAKSIREGIEYLCYPFREDLSKFIRSPLRDENDPEQNFLNEEEKRYRVLNCELFPEMSKRRL